MDDAAAQPVGNVIGVADHYAAFVKLCRLRIEQLGITFETVDAICGFPLRYTAKILTEAKGMSAYTLFTLARGLALLPAFTHDHAQHRALQHHSEWVLLRRSGPRWRRKHNSKKHKKHKLHPDFLKMRALRANLIRTKKLKPKRRREIARNAAMARWERVRACATP
jgi:hypothetical protein